MNRPLLKVGSKLKAKKTSVERKMLDCLQPRRAELMSKGKIQFKFVDN